MWAGNEINFDVSEVGNENTDETKNVIKNIFSIHLLLLRGVVGYSAAKSPDLPEDLGLFCLGYKISRKTNNSTNIKEFTWKFLKYKCDFLLQKEPKVSKYGFWVR